MINPSSLPIYGTLLDALKSEDFFPDGGTLAYGYAHCFARMHWGSGGPNFSFCCMKNSHMQLQDHALMPRRHRACRLRRCKHAYAHNSESTGAAFPKLQMCLGFCGAYDYDM